MADGGPLFPELDSKARSRMKKSAEDEEEEEGDKHFDRTRPESGSCIETESDAKFECVACDKKFSGYLPYKRHQKGKKHVKAVAARRKEEEARQDAESDNLKLKFCLPEQFPSCRVCHKDFSYFESYYAHLKSKSHKQKVMKASVPQQVKEGDEIDADKKLSRSGSHKIATEGDPDPQHRAATVADQKATAFECDDCEKVYHKLTPYSQQLMRKYHERRAELWRTFFNISLVKTDAEGMFCMEDGAVVCKACTMSFSGPESADVHLKSKNHAKQLDRYVRKLQRKGTEETSKEPGDEKKASDKDVPKMPDPSVLKRMDALASTASSGDKEAEKTSKESGDEKDEKASDKDA